MTIHLRPVPGFLSAALEQKQRAIRADLERSEGRGVMQFRRQRHLNREQPELDKQTRKRRASEEFRQQGMVQ